MNRGDGNQTIAEECRDCAAEPLALALLVWRKDGDAKPIDYETLHVQVMLKAEALVAEHHVPLKAPL